VNRPRSGGTRTGLRSAESPGLVCGTSSGVVNKLCFPSPATTNTHAINLVSDSFAYPCFPPKPSPSLLLAARFAVHALLVTAALSCDVTIRFLFRTCPSPQLVGLSSQHPWEHASQAVHPVAPTEDLFRRGRRHLHLCRAAAAHDEAHHLADIPYPLPTRRQGHQHVGRRQRSHHARRRPVAAFTGQLLLPRVWCSRW